MGIEADTDKIQDLNENWPANSEGISEADNHLRLIKKVLKENFSNFIKGLNKSSEDMNSLDKFMGNSIQTIWKMQDKYLPPSGEQRQLEIESTGLLGIVLSNIPIGSFIYSEIPPEKINAIYGENIFVIPEGQTIPEDTQYYKITGKKILPNFFDGDKCAFLRPCGENNLNLGIKKEFTTAPNGLGIIDTFNFEELHNHGGGIHTHRIRFNNGAFRSFWGQDDDSGFHPNLDHKTTGQIWYDLPKPATKDYSHTHEVNFFGQDETAPPHYLLYLYLRIN